MSATAYQLEVVEAATKSLTLEGSGQKVTWLMCLAYEVQEGNARWVGTVYNMTLDRPVRVGKRGELRRIMDSLEEGLTWYRRTVA